MTGVFLVGWPGVPGSVLVGVAVPVGDAVPVGVTVLVGPADGEAVGSVPLFSSPVMASVTPWALSKATAMYPSVFWSV